MSNGKDPAETIINVRTREGVDIEEIDIEKDVVEITWDDGWHDTYYSKEHATELMKKRYRLVKRY